MARPRFSAASYRDPKGSTEQLLKFSMARPSTIVKLLDTPCNKSMRIFLYIDDQLCTGLNLELTSRGGAAGSASSSRNSGS